MSITEKTLKILEKTREDMNEIKKKLNRESSEEESSDRPLGRSRDPVSRRTPKRTSRPPFRRETSEEIPDNGEDGEDYVDTRSKKISSNVIDPDFVIKSTDNNANYTELLKQFCTQAFYRLNFHFDVFKNGLVCIGDISYKLHSNSHHFIVLNREFTFYYFDSDDDIKKTMELSKETVSKKLFTKFL